MIKDECFWVEVTVDPTRLSLTHCEIGSLLLVTKPTRIYYKDLYHIVDGLYNAEGKKLTGYVIHESMFERLKCNWKGKLA